MELKGYIKFAETPEKVLQLLADTFRTGGAPDLAFAIEEKIRDFARGDYCKECGYNKEKGCIKCDENPQCKCGEPLYCPTCEDTSDSTT